MTYPDRRRSEPARELSRRTRLASRPNGYPLEASVARMQPRAHIGLNVVRAGLAVYLEKGKLMLIEILVVLAIIALALFIWRNMVGRRA